MSSIKSYRSFEEKIALLPEEIKGWFVGSADFFKQEYQELPETLEGEMSESGFLEITKAIQGVWDAIERLEYEEEKCEDSIKLLEKELKKAQAKNNQRAIEHIERLLEGDRKLLKDQKNYRKILNSSESGVADTQKAYLTWVMSTIDD